MSGRHTNMQQHVGQTYNFLKVDSISTETYKYKEKDIKRTLFNCTCECGNTKTILASNAIKGITKSCGCKKKELINTANRLYYENNNNKSVEKRMFSSYKKHGKDFNLTFEEFSTIITKDCSYCGDKPSKERFSKNGNLSVLLNGIDRVNSSEGYNLNNCVPCCTTCNIMKNTLTIEEFMRHIIKIYKSNALDLYPDFKGR
jgi:hypothetical protein